MGSSILESFELEPPTPIHRAAAGRLWRAWRLYTALTAVVGLGLTIWTALAFQRDAASLGLMQRGLIIVYWSWIVLLSIHLMTNLPQP
jgi:hypothetical protein